MFTGFKLYTDNTFSAYKEEGAAIFEKNQNDIGAEIDNFLSLDGSINGTEMQESWFPEIKADIFLSHSHKDRDKALGLAGFLKKSFDLNVFIDSCVWGYANDLLREMDEKYCKNENGFTYDYEKRNYSTSHVHTMLTTALVKMIHNTECLFFLNTPNSMETQDNISSKTLSPWIYMEIAMSSMIEKVEPVRRKGFLKKALFENTEIASKSLIVKYDVKTDHLTNLKQADLDVWERRLQATPAWVQADLVFNSLDLLYQDHNRIKTEEKVEEYGA